MAYEYPLPTMEQRGVTFCEGRHDTYPEIDPATKSNHSGRAVFVTGASKGIGRCTAIAYAKAGASHIAIAARSGLDDVEADMLKAAKAAGKPEPKVLKLKLDLQDRESINNNLKEIEASFGRLDVLINNAGYLGPFLPIAESDEDDYWLTWEINFRGLYWVTKTFLPLLIKSADGLQTVVNVSSIGALSPRFGGSSYQTSKSAVLKFTEYICREYGDRGVLAYSVHPGGVMTELAKRMPSDTHSILQDTPEMGGDTMVFLTQEKRTWLAGRYVSCNWYMPEFLSKEDEIVKGDKLKLKLVI